MDVSLGDEDHDGDDGDDDEAQVVEKFILRDVKIVKSDFCGCPAQLRLCQLLDNPTSSPEKFSTNQSLTLPSKGVDQLT